MPQLSKKSLSYLAVIGAGAGVLLMMVRGYYAISFTEPLQGATRGAEYETLYSIWKYVFGGIVYTDQTKIPFDGSFYNWLFYAFYGEITGLVLKALSLGDAWLPTITRLITFSGLVVGSFLAYRSFVDLLEVKDRCLKLLCGSFAVFVFFGPLVGFFGISATPDIWPLVFTLVATWIFIRYYGSCQLGTILIVCLFSYLAWGFKQNFVYAPATVGLYLLLHRRWRDAIILTIIMVSAGLVTLSIGGDDYVSIVHFGSTHIFFTANLVVRNVINAIVKSLPIMAVMFAILTDYSNARDVVLSKIRQQPLMSIPLLGSLVTGVEAIATSGLQAASESHFFVVSYFLTFSVLSIIVWSYQSGSVPKFFAVTSAMGWIGNTLAVGSVLVGLQGLLSVRSSHNDLMTRKACLVNLRQPFFISDHYLALPWMARSKKSFVLHANYTMDRAAGINMEGDGVGGLIDKGYFATVVISEGRKGYFDGSDLSLYQRRGKSCGGLEIYDRKTAPKFSIPPKTD